MTEAIEPCPNCGKACQPCANKSPWSAKWIECGDVACQYRGPMSLAMDDEKQGAIAMHNRIARAVREADELRADISAYIRAASIEAQSAIKAEAERDRISAMHESSAARAEHWRERAEKAEAERDQYRQLIEAHNAKITAECERRRTAVWVCNVVGNCEHCPRRYLIDLPEAKL